MGMESNAYGMTGEFGTGIGGLIIAGGQSTRMGSDKALLGLGGETLLARLVRQLAGICDRIVIAVGDGQRIAAYKAALEPVLAESKKKVTFAIDRYAGCGPLAGLHAGLSELQGGYALVVGCDMPCVSEALVARMLRAAWREDADAVHAAGEPFHALYHTRAARQALEHLEREDYRFMQLLERMRTVQVEPQTEEERQAFMNLNTPEAYRAYADAAGDR